LEKSFNQKRQFNVFLRGRGHNGGIDMHSQSAQGGGGVWQGWKEDEGRAFREERALLFALVREDHPVTWFEDRGPKRKKAEGETAGTLQFQT